MSDSLQQELKKFELPTRTDFPWVGKVITTMGVILSLLHIWLTPYLPCQSFGSRRPTLLALRSFVHFGIPPISH